ncbi:hypothetical protein [Streptomyces thermolineatus]|uniref:hypothetical protein n=1 Tax=Streptomyces thermolineatus TaxID=44033 RepID=UPI0031DA8924
MSAERRTPRSRRLLRAFGPALLAGALAISPAVASQASAATSTETSQAATESTSVPREYRQGYRDGFAFGLADAADNCRKDGSPVYGLFRTETSRTNLYERGFVAGYNAGFRVGYRAHCWI